MKVPIAILLAVWLFRLSHANDESVEAQKNEADASTSAPVTTSGCLDPTCATPERKIAGRMSSIPEDDLQCALYMAPSSLADAGWGLYAGVDLKQNEAVGHGDLIIPILDKFKTIPFRGQQRFLSWLRYVWPDKVDAFYHSQTKAFPEIPLSMFPDDGLNAATGLQWYDDDDQRISVFSPGIASLANSHQQWINLRLIPHQAQASFAALHNIQAGSELFLDYGAEFHKRMEDKRRSVTDHDTLLDYYKYMDFTTLPTEDDKRGQLNRKTRHKKKKHKRKEVQETGYDREVPLQQNHSINNRKPLRWLKQNGICVDKLTSESSTDAGRRAFAKHRIIEDEIIAPAPLLALKREDLVIYEVEESSSTHRSTLNFENAVWKEFLLNYCYGHPESQLLLVPYSPIVNLIQHSSEEPNAKIQWSTEQDFLDLHPIDVLDLSGRLRMDFVALRDIEEGEEILIDYGSAWESAAHRFDGNVSDFRHERGVPEGFFPDHWLNTSVIYELAEFDTPLQPGELRPMVWKHNGKPVAENAWQIGLPDGFSTSLYDYSKKLGLVDLYEKLLYEDFLGSNDWYVFDTIEGEWFAQKYMAKAWKFNMHYIAAWSERARVGFLRALHTAGFQVALETIGSNMGLQNLTCFHASFMGVSECENSFTHTDVYATDQAGFNLVFPLLLVPGSSPELDVQADDPNIVISINYQYNTAIVMGDWGYHKTSPNDYNDFGKMRIVVGAYCGQLSDKNKEMFAYIYDGEDPAPFMNQFIDLQEVHWSSDGQHSLSLPNLNLDSM